MNMEIRMNMFREPYDEGSFPPVFFDTSGDKISVQTFGTASELPLPVRIVERQLKFTVK